MMAVLSHVITSTMNPDRLSRCSLARRLAAVFYDTLLLIAIWFIATAMLLPLTQGQAINGDSYLYKQYLLIIAYFYFCWHWRKGQQTLGMRAWKVILVNSDRTPPDWTSLSKRFFVALLSWLALGLGFWWSLLDKEQRSWHDIASDTRLMVNKIKPEQKN